MPIELAVAAVTVLGTILVALIQVHGRPAHGAADVRQMNAPRIARACSGCGAKVVAPLCPYCGAP